jgi:transcriptional regulator with XRE-family HTH domain
MAKFRRAILAVEAVRRNREQLARLGGEIRAARKRRRLTQAALGALVELSQTTISRLELGLGGGLTVDTWQRVAIALDLPLRLELGRDPLAGVRDAGHLAIQELILRTGRQAGFERIFELATRPANPNRSGDVGLRSDRLRWLVLVEAWNTFGDVGASVRSTDRKLAEAEDLATALWGNATTSSPVAGSSDRRARTAPCSPATRSCSRLDSPGRQSAGWPLSRRVRVLRFGPVSSGVTLARRASSRCAERFMGRPDRPRQKSGCVRG